MTTDSMIDEKEINFMKVVIEVQLFIDHLRIWKYKYYTSIDIRSFFDHNRTDKLINKDRSCMFFDYDENIITQYWIWVSDRREVIKHHKMTFSKNEKWRSNSLNLSKTIFNILSNRWFVNRSCKTAQKTFIIIINVITNLPFNENIQINSSIAKKVQDFDTIISNFTVDSIFIINQDVKYNDESEINEFIAKSTVQTRAKLIVLIKLLSTFKQFLHVTISKRKRKITSNEKKRDEHRDKIVRIMLILITQDFDRINTIEWVLFVEVSSKFSKEFVDKFVISVLKSYEKTINDSIWKKL